MKNVLIIISLTAIFVTGLLAFPNIVERVLPTSGITQLEVANHADSVVAIGEVSKRAAKIETAAMEMVVGDVYVSEGQILELGDIIASIDKDATVMAAIQQKANVGGTFGDFSGMTGNGQLEGMKGSVPENILARNSGIIERLDIRFGQQLAQGETMLTYTGGDDMFVSTVISENLISKVAVGQVAQITGSGFGDLVYSGVVEEISPTAKKQYTGAVQDTVVEVLVKFDEPDERIRMGYSAQVKIQTSDIEMVGILPYEAIVQEDNEEFVYVFSNGLSIKKEVQTGRELAEGVEIKGGIKAQDKIITSPEKVKNEAYVKIIN